MNGSIRVSAKTVDDAITEALIQLGVTSDRLEYEVIEKGSSGFLGIGMKQAVIEARRKPEPVAEVKEETIPVEEVKPSVVKEQVSEPVQEKQEEKAEEEPARKKATELAEVSDEAIKAVEAFLNDTLKAMDMDVEIVSEVDSEGALSVEMKGSNMGILIGTFSSLDLVLLITKTRSPSTARALPASKKKSRRRFSSFPASIPINRAPLVLAIKVCFISPIPTVGRTCSRGFLPAARCMNGLFGKRALLVPRKSFTRKIIAICRT